MSDEARSRVASERRERGYFSVRSAASAASNAGAEISYTTWSEWEKGKREIGDAMRRAVMVLFGWPADWPENPPDEDPPPTSGAGVTPAEFDREVSSLRAGLEAERAARRSEVQELRDQAEELIDQLAALSAAVDDLRRGAGAGSPRAATE